MRIMIPVSDFRRNSSSSCRFAKRYKLQFRAPAVKRQFRDTRAWLEALSRRCMVFRPSVMEHASLHGVPGLIVISRILDIEAGLMQKN